MKRKHEEDETQTLHPGSEKRRLGWAKLEPTVYPLLLKLVDSEGGSDAIYPNLADISPPLTVTLFGRRRE